MCVEGLAKIHGEIWPHASDYVTISIIVPVGNGKSDFSVPYRLL